MVGVLLVAGCATPRVHPADWRARLLKATLAADWRDFGACEALFSGLDRFHEAACCAAQAGRRDEAFALLERQPAAGYFTARDLEKDSDLSALHEDPRWPALVARVTEQLARLEATQHAEVRRVYDEDQADRRHPRTIDWAVVGPRDQARIARAKALVAEGALRTTRDFTRAAMLLQHSGAVEDTLLANRLAHRAVELDPENQAARWLVAASLDRALDQQGLPQRHGTQYRVDDAGRRTLVPLDGAATDEERVEWGVDPLPVLQRGYAP